MLKEKKSFMFQFSGTVFQRITDFCVPTKFWTHFSSVPKCVVTKYEFIMKYHNETCLKTQF